MAIRVLMLTQWFDPESSFKGLVFARELQRQGFEVEVLTGFPNYPGGKLYPGYRVRWYQKEIMGGIRVNRVPLYPSHDRSAWRRIFNYASFAASSLIYGLFFLRRPDVIYAYHPPLTVGVTAALLRVLRRIPVIYDVQDMWPDTLRVSGMLNSEHALRLVGAVCRWVYRRVDHIAVLSPGFERLLVDRGVPRENISVIPNWAAELALDTPQGAPPERFPDARHFRILFAGNMGKAQALDTVLDAAMLQKSHGSNVVWVLMGAGIDVDRLKRKAEAQGLDNVIFLPRVPISEVGAALQAADALLVHLRKDPLFQITIPSKTQAYMTIGKPILMAVEGDAADMVRESGSGLVIESENPQALCDAAERLAGMSMQAREAMGARARAYYQDKLSLEKGVAQFADIIHRLAGRA
ncbi:glycosyltransferase family 4 protein [Castellaniella sp.]|uniref:glycosyltransferase family 4 protein n=1 Tax=Castellaniella sp. TaxID=1955812 RepID=UPI003566AF6C